MRILYHHRTASRDGQEVHIRELIAAFRALGHEVLVVAPGGDPTATIGEGTGDMGGSRKGLGALRALVPDFLMPLANAAYSTLFKRKILTAGRRFRPDVVYERHALNNTVGRDTARALGVPLLLEVNAPLSREEFEQKRLHSLEPALSREMSVVRDAGIVFAVTDVLKRILIEDGVSPERIEVVHNGASSELLNAPVDRSRRQEFAPCSEIVLGFVGFPRPWHGLDRILRVLASARSEALARTRFVVAGEGPAVGDLARISEELRLAERVRFIGVLGRCEVLSFLDAIDIGLQPAATRYASPLKLFEYLARSVPVIAPRQPNIEEIVVDERSALLFDPRAPGDLERQLVRLVEDTDLRRRIAAGGRSRIDEAGFTWSKNAERIARAAQRLVSSRTP